MIGYYNKIKNKNQLGLSILEALVSTVIVGIGFVAIFQMVNYSVQSIDVSGERTKANYLVSMLTEDILGNRNSLYGIDSKDAGIIINEFGEPVRQNDEGTTVVYKKFTDHLLENPWKVNSCANKSNFDSVSEIKDIYAAGTESVDAPSNKLRKWNMIFEEDRNLKCRGSKDIKTIKIFKLCRWDHCDFIKDTIFDQAMYIGRIQININNGKKRKYLYFQADYKLKD